MKSIRSQVLTGILGATACAVVVVAADAEKLKSVDSVSVKNGELSAVMKGESFHPTNSVVMPLDIKVMTNLTFTVKDGSPRKLKEGQTLSKNGMLLSPDGSLMPVVDHVAMINGKPTLVVDGSASVIQSPRKLANGTQVLPDGTIYSPTGSRTKLLDGQMYQLSGSAIPATDTVTLKDGKVVVQKDGGMLEVAPGRTLMMNDGTKVFGDGQLKYSDGKTRNLKEGETIEIMGVRRR